MDTEDTETMERWASTPQDLPGAADWTAQQLDEQARVIAIPKRLEDASTNEFIASTEKEARDGDIIEQSSWRLTEYKLNPVVLDNHYGENIGRTEKVQVVGDELHALIRWDDSDENPAGKRAARAHREGWRRAVSVRWITGNRTARNKLPEDHRHYSKGRKVEGYFGPVVVVGDLLTRCTLLEISSVDVPADAHALQTRFFVPPVARMVPDEVARFDLLQAIDEAHTDGRLIQSAGFRAVVADILLDAARDDKGAFRRALSAFFADLEPKAPPAPRTVASWLQGS